MRVSVVLEQRFDCTPDGSVWDQTTCSYPFWCRYLEVFDRVQIIARVHNIDSVPENYSLVNGPDVEITPIPLYIGPCQFLSRAIKVWQAAKNSVSHNDAVVLRIPSLIASCVQPSLSRNGHPYAVEVVGDPYDVFALATFRHPLSPFFRWWFTRQVKRQCKNASGTAYVTEKTLQSRYPGEADTFSAYYSSVDLPDIAFSESLHHLNSKSLKKTVVFVGSLAQLYKGPDVLIDAVAKCMKTGMNITLLMIGDGMYRSLLEKRVKTLGLSERIHFLGQLPAGEAVREQLDKSDLFVLPAKTEGLPRAMIEAMARGLPCIGSNVGGIPELLAPSDMVPPGDVNALAKKFQAVLSDHRLMMRMSEQNYLKANEYRKDLLDKKRNAFYQHLRNITEEWLKSEVRP